MASCAIKEKVSEGSQVPLGLSSRRWNTSSCFLSLLRRPGKNLKQQFAHFWLMHFWFFSSLPFRQITSQSGSWVPHCLQKAEKLGTRDGIYLHKIINILDIHNSDFCNWISSAQFLFAASAIRMQTPSSDCCLLQTNVVQHRPRFAFLVLGTYALRSSLQTQQKLHKVSVNKIS